MLFDYSGLKNALERYEKAESVIERSYNCEWDDEIHDSFKKFVVACEETVKSIKIIGRQVEQICQDLNSAHIEQEKSAAEKLNREAADLCQKARSLL